MSFLLELEVSDLTDEQCLAVTKACRDRGAWPVEFAPRGRWRWSRRPTLILPDEIDGRHLLSDDADWNQPAWNMEPDLLAPFAEAIRIMGELLPQGFALRATWVGDKVREKRDLGANELAELVLASQLNEFTRYRVPPRIQHSSG